MALQGANAMTHNVIIGTAGHVDHGKTWLIKALTGVDTDRLQEEKNGVSRSNWALRAFRMTKA